MKRLVALLPVLVALQVGVQPALAWTWPVDGPVLRPFVLGDDPYAAGQHRGIDIAASAGTPVRAPAAGVVSFAGTVPGGGRTVTIRTDTGYSVTLLHLGAVAAAARALVAEGEVVGAAGLSGDAEVEGPYVHLGVRLTSDPHGYVDPLRFLPTRSASEVPADGPAPAEDPAPAPEPAPAQPHTGSLPAEPSQSPAKKGGDAAAHAPGLPTVPAHAGRPAARPLEHPADPVRPPLGVQKVEETASEPAAHPGPAPRAGADPLRFDGPLASGEPARRRTAADGPATAEPDVGHGALRVAIPLAVLALAGLTGLGVLRRQLRDAHATNRPAAVLLDVARPPAEDTDRARLAEQDHLVLDGDLERILLREAEALSNLDRDDDPAELVDVANDPRRRPSCTRRGGHSLHTPRSGRSRARLARAG
jgi:hypothetical protein